MGSEKPQFGKREALPVEEEFTPEEKEQLAGLLKRRDEIEQWLEAGESGVYRGADEGLIDELNVKIMRIKREGLARRIQSLRERGVDTTMLEKRLTELDKKISDSSDADAERAEGPPESAPEDGAA